MSVSVISGPESSGGLYGPRTHPNATKRQAKELASQERREQAWQLKLEGHSERRIAKQLGISNVRVHQYLVQELRLIRTRRQQIAEHYVTLQTERLERIIGRWAARAAGIFSPEEQAWPPAVRAATMFKAEQLRLRAIVELNRIHGLYAPEQHELAVRPADGRYVAEWGDTVMALPPPMADGADPIDITPGANGSPNGDGEAAA